MAGKLLFLYTILKKVLIVLFPFAPFITEEIYSYLPDHLVSIYEESYPTLFGFSYDQDKIEVANSLRGAIKEIRNHKSQLSLAPNAPITLIFHGEKEVQDMVEIYLSRFGFAKEIKTSLEKRDDYIYFSKFALAFEEDDSAEGKERIAKRIEFLKKEIMRGEKMLGNQNFVNKAKPEVVQAEKTKLEKNKEELAKYTK